MKELPLAIYERQFSSILLQVQVRGEFLHMCLWVKFYIGGGGEGLFRFGICRSQLKDYPFPIPYPYKLAQLFPNAWQVALPAKSVELKL